MSSPPAAAATWSMPSPRRSPAVAAARWRCVPTSATSRRWPPSAMPAFAISAASTSWSRRRASPSACRHSQMADADWHRILDTNLTGVLRACQVFGAPMIERKRGRVITIASLASFVGLHEVAAYTASKAGVAGLTRALAVEWAPHGVTVNAIAPGVFETDMNRELLKLGRGQEFLVRTPMKRFGRVEELVGAAVFLASDAGSFVTGQVIAVDGGFLASGVNQ